MQNYPRPPSVVQPPPPQQQGYGGYNHPPQQPPTYQQPPSYGGYAQQSQYGGYNPPPQQQYGQYGYGSIYQPQIINHPLKPFFDAVDTDRSGKITWIELQKALTQPGGEFTGRVFNERCARRLIKMFDKNGNGEIDFEEFVQLHQFLLQMKQGFEFVDKDKSGTLSFQEVSTALMQSGYRIGINVVQKMFNMVDVQRKGFLNFDGYIELCVFVGSIRNAFQPRDIYRNGTAMFTFDQFLEACTEFYV
ncbi:hypothetical protein FDP41_011401 [Naegleria fowleri]|uniref:EF-hand domain-containing protein n=1 Tax=Naegleria fowleri TaxID=5763 RepID=A0A6A5C5V6_NAEFO|nr:uncharacterized protein FDP41_011401 [Naegleria fowleri]KAF0982471.1 hypothetical protein FDP41_011401 [Naegleria fowleri]CAG4714099.1 unnamed protein product [Naegleria fowleri]